MNRQKSIKSHTRKQKRPRRAFPYLEVAKMWAEGHSIAFIAHAIDRVDKSNPRDPYHSLRNFLFRMHKGYRNERGRMVRLPHRISRNRVIACRKAGLRVWA